MRSVWLASYPKSGNTWMRALLANLVGGDKAADINALDFEAGIASSRNGFEAVSLIDSTLLTHDEIDLLRPAVYADRRKAAARNDIPPGRLPVRVVKVHDAYTRNAVGTPLLGEADGAIVIVRDPRDIACSLAAHRRCGLDEAIALMADPTSALCGRADRLDSQLRQTVTSWSGHVASWLDQTDIPVLLLRYEDMLGDTAGSLRRTLDFLGWSKSDEAIARAVHHARFAVLAEQERSTGFREAPQGSTFFRRGVAGAWRNDLNRDQVRIIENAHRVVMARLGYALSPADVERQTPRQRTPGSLVRRFAQIDMRRRALLAEAAITLMAARLALAIVPFPALARRLGSYAARGDRPHAHPLPKRQSAVIDDVSWAVTRAARHVPFRAVCLPQALAARMMLTRRGVPSALHFGAMVADGTLKTHAWLDAGGVPVTGYPVEAEFAEVGCFT